MFAGLCPLQIFSTHIKHLLTMLVNLSLFDKGRSTTLDQWSAAWRVGFHQLKVKTLLVADCIAIGLALKRTDISHLDDRK